MIDGLRNIIFTQKKFWFFLIIFIVVLIIYILFAQKGFQNYHYFVPLANSILHGRLDVEPTPSMNELVPVNGKYYVVYPPMPAIILLPVVLFTGENLNQVWPSVFIAALAVAFFHLLAKRFTKKEWVSILLTLLFGFGTNFFLSSLIGFGWFFAHVVAVLFMILGLLAAAHQKPLLAGLGLSAAFLSRLPTILALPVFVYLILQDKKRNEYFQNLLKFFSPIFFMIIIYGLYNFYRFDNVFQTGYSLIPGVLQEPWYQKGVFDISYIPRQLEVIFLAMPKISLSFPFLMPSVRGMALWLTTPALLLIFFTRIRQKVNVYFLASALLVALPSLMHGTTGFNQFGYRFSLDFIVLLLIPLVASFQRVGWKVAALTLGFSLVINFWVATLFYLKEFSI